MDKTNDFRRIENGITRMAVLLIFVLLLGVVEERDNDAESQTACRKFTADKEIQNLIASGRRGAEPCPCIEQKIILDKTFEKTENCYRQWFFQEGAKQMCCYSENGNLITEGSSAGYLLLESREEVIGRAHKHCCGNDSIIYKHSCQSFYEINSPDNCSAYHPPSAVTSSGDPRIETIDGNNYYDFNGHGEYVFLTDNTNFEIQARTGYVVKGNNDSTMFTAFALSDKQNGEQIELHYDRGVNDIRFYRDGTYNAICNASSPKGNGGLYPCEMPTQYSCQVLAGGGQIIVYKCGFGDYAKQIVFGTDNFMSIQITHSRKNVSRENLTGLAGHQEDGFYIMRNKSRVAVNASASKRFDFAESWSLRNESESLFYYNDTGGNFIFYNKHHTRPKFLEDFVGNLTALFGNFTDENITLFNNTCRNYWNNDPNEQCLLTIARTGDYSLGEAVMVEVNATRRKWEIMNNIPPKFKSGEVKGITIIHDQIWEFNFTEHVKVGTQNDLNYTVHTEIPKEEYNLTSDGTFTWLVGTGLREKEASITFIAKDRLNGTASKRIMITYCGCETADECDFNVTQEANTNSSVGFTRANCNCPEYYTGDFCEKWNDPCANISCFDQSTCNGNISKQEVGDSWPCAKCNAGTKSMGFIGGKQTCSDVNECLLDSDGCQHHCNNTDGSYFCECNSGYELESDGHSCKDIDECTRHTHFCSKNELCVNTKGNATCQCAPGYNRKMKNDSCTKVEGGSYAGSIVFQLVEVNPKANPVNGLSNKSINTEKNRNIIQQKLNEGFKDTEGYIDVEVIELYVVLRLPNNSRSRREAKNKNKEFDLHSNYVVTMNTTNEDSNKILNALRHSFENSNAKNGDINLGNTNLKVFTSTARIKDLPEKFCTFKDRVNCDLETTICKDTDGDYECNCKPGYERATNSKTFCNDIDECTVSKSSMESDLCVKGICENTPGSWQCNCKPDTKLKNTTHQNILRFRCEGEFQYVGKASVMVSTPSYNTSDVYELFDEVLSDTFNGTELPCLADQNVYTSDIFWDIEVLNKSSEVYNSSLLTVYYILHLGESLTNEQVDQVQNGTLSNIVGCYFNNSQVNITLMHSSIFEEDSYNLCDIKGKTNCVLETTNCAVGNGSFSCPCKNGYRSYISNYCLDIDECKEDLVSCPGGSCSNTVGNWTCNCNSTSEFKWINETYGECLDKNECDYPEKYRCRGPSNSSICVDKVAGWSCECANGYTPRNITDDIRLCEDIDECLTDKLSCQGGTCQNVDGSFHCFCPSGFTNSAYSIKPYHAIHATYNATHITCTDIDECNETEVNQSCIKGDCINIPGNWTCYCSDEIYSTRKEIINGTFRCLGDFQYVGYMRLLWVANATINSTKADAFFHDKITGMFKNSTIRLRNKTDDSFTVSDIFRNLSLIQNISMRDSEGHSYSINITYIVQIGEPLATKYVKNFQNEIFKQRNPLSVEPGPDTVFLSDVSIYDDSVYSICNIPGKTKCDVNTTKCIASKGSYTCQCNEGYYNNTDNKSRCTDIDECVDGKHNCPAGAHCSNTMGNWTCKCPSGYEPNFIDKKNISCIDVDECNNTSKYKCNGPDGSFSCINTVGGWHCNCTDGYSAINDTEDHRKCEDVNECDEALSCIGGNCTNKNGTFECTCPPGYNHTAYGSGNNINCTDINECSRQDIKESCINGQCQNEDGNWSCNCNHNIYNTLKYIGNGTYRCLGDFQYFGRTTFVSLSSLNSASINKPQVKMNFNEKISTLFSQSNIKINYTKGSSTMSDIFRNISAMTVNVTNSSNGDTSVWISYVIQIGEQSTTDSVKNFQKQLFDLNKHIDLTIGLETAYLKTSEIITESTYNVCNISGKTHCDSETTNCVGHNGSYSCECKEGFNRTDDPFICSDIDECLDARYKCDNRGKCNNTDGNWTCTCESGFEPNFLDKYNISCIDINECQYKEKYVCNDGTCNNTIGDWVCECPSGYYRIENTTDSFTCLDIDECNNSSYSCSNDGNCSNSVGNWTCTCPSGYEPKVLNTYAKTCHDINECIQNDTYHCKGPVDSATCNNTVGGWRCECKVGYTAKNKTEHYRVCEDVNECYDPLACSGGKCKNENGTFDCVCPSGFTKISDKIVKDHFTCTDVNECDANKIKTNNSCIRGSCHNIPGDWECNCNDIIYNKKRYLGNHTNRCLGDFQYIGSITLYWSQYKKEKFQLVNMYFKEMISQAYNHSNATVSPSDSYAVSDIFRSSEVLKIEVTSIPNVLNVSYILHFGEPLSPVDIAKCQQKVFNTSKRYQFGTDYVYLQSERINNDNEFNLCDIDGKTRCDLQSTNCTVSNGSYSCPCKEGYNKTEDPFKCKDINECDGNVVHCEWNDCRNTAGSWECECNETSLFEKHNETYGLCQDIDECERNETYICNDGNCTDKVGGWECGCSAGFYAEPIKKGFIYSCKDFNECLRPNLHICSNGGTCQNTNGNWTCECRTGYEAVYINQTQIECRDINECEKPDQFTCTGPKNSSTCYDILGSWQCNCSEGFKPKNISSNIRTCEDINECHDESSCVKGECINTEGSFLCQCEPGYKIVSKAGHSACIDIDECAVNKNPCLEALGCENTEGDWTCLCSKGLDVRIVNESSKICGGQYQYVSSMSFTVVGTVVDVAKVQAALQKQIQEMYMQTLNDDSVWIEIIKIHGLQGAERRKRAPTRDISAEYIIHTSEKKNETELQEVEEVYKEQKCGNGTNNCQAEDIGGVSMVFNSVLVLNASAICNTSRNHCDEKISTCSSDEGKLKCLCNKGYEKKNTNSLQCFDTDECQSTDACPKGETCKNTVGSWDCSCQNGLKAIETEPGKRVCIDPCTKPHMECFISSTCKPFDNEDGYICGCEKGRKGKYCKEIDHNFKESKQQTTLIAVGSSLGGLVLILTAVILAVCRSRAGKIKEAERISMRHMDTNGFKSFDDSYLTNQYMRDRDDGGGSFYSHRLSNLSLPYEQQNYENRNGHLPKPHRLPRPSFHGSMPNLANGDAHVNRFDNRRYSVEEPRRVSSYNRDLDSNYDMDWRAPRNNMNGRRSPSPDYRRSMSPRPDYHRREKLNRSKDSGVGNGYSSGSNEYRRPEKRREYYYANRRSTNF